MLYLQSKAYTKSFPFTLVGGTNGHFVLVANNIAYQIFYPVNAYIIPDFLGELPSLSRSTGPVIVKRLCVHNTDIELLQESNLVERTILNKISYTLSKTYMITLINKETVVVDGSIQSTMEYLFVTYRNTSEKSLNRMRQSTINHTYIHTDTISNAFNIFHKYSMMS